MIVITLIELAAVVLITARILYSYASKDVPLVVSIITFITWVVSFSIVVLIPLDVYYTLRVANGDEDAIDPWNNTKAAWQYVYFINMALSFLVLPLLQEYEDAGDFTPKERFKRSVKINLIQQAVAGVLGVIFIVYLLIKKGLSWDDLVTFLVALANFVGILMVIVLLGYGLVELPRAYFNQSKMTRMLKTHQCGVRILEENKVDSESELDDLIGRVYVITRMKNLKDEEIHAASEILKQCPTDRVKSVTSCYPQSEQAKHEQNIKDEGLTINLSTLIEYNRKVKKSLAELRRSEAKWDQTLEKAFFLEDILRNQENPPEDWRLKSSLKAPREDALGKFLDAFEYVYWVKLHTVIYIGFGIIFSIFSLLVLLGELSIILRSDDDSSEDSIFRSILNATLNPIGLQFTCLLPLVYIVTGVYSGLFNIKITGFYGLYPNHLTDASSLVFFAINFSRVSAPICYNFLQMINLNGTAFHAVTGELVQIPILGQSMTTILPMILVVFVILNVLNIWGKILSFIGLGRLQFTAQTSDEKINEGIDLLRKARVDYERHVVGKIATPTTANSYKTNIKLESRGMRLNDDSDL